MVAVKTLRTCREVADDVRPSGLVAGEAREHRWLALRRRRPVVDDGLPVPAHEADRGPSAGCSVADACSKMAGSPRGRPSGG
jgi:hypothetical protein